MRTAGTSSWPSPTSAPSCCTSTVESSTRWSGVPPRWRGRRSCPPRTGATSTTSRCGRHTASSCASGASTCAGCPPPTTYAATADTHPIERPLTPIEGAPPATTAWWTMCSLDEAEWASGARSVPGDAGALDAFDDPALEEEEHQQQRHDGDERGHEELADLHRLCGEEGRQRDLHRPRLLVAADDERPEEGVPRPDEGDRADGGDEAQRVRHDDPPEGAPVAEAVDEGRLLDLLGEAEEELPEEERRERLEEAGHDEPLQRRDPAEGRDEDEARHERHGRRDEQGRGDRVEDGVGPPVGDARQAVARETGDDEHPDRLRHRDDARVEQAARHRDGRVVEQAGEVGGLPHRRQPVEVGGAEVLLAHEGAADEQVERDEEEQRGNEQRCVAGPPGQARLTPAAHDRHQSPRSPSRSRRPWPTATIAMMSVRMTAPAEP